MLQTLLAIPGNPCTHLLQCVKALPVLADVFKLTLWVFQSVVVDHVPQMFSCFPQPCTMHLLIPCISHSYSWVVLTQSYFGVQWNTPSSSFVVNIYLLLQLLFHHLLFCFSWRNSGIIKNYVPIATYPEFVMYSFCIIAILK